MSNVQIKYGDAVIATLTGKQKVVMSCKDKLLTSNIVITALVGQTEEEPDYVQPLLVTPTVFLKGDRLAIHDYQSGASSFDLVVDGEVHSTLSNVPTISFTLEHAYDTATSTTCYADEGMTWADWITSEYAPSGGYCGSTYVYYGDDEVWYVTPTDLIVDGETYMYGSDTHSGGSN